MASAPQGDSPAATAHATLTSRTGVEVRVKKGTGASLEETGQGQGDQSLQAQPEGHVTKASDSELEEGFLNAFQKISVSNQSGSHPDARRASAEASVQEIPPPLAPPQCRPVLVKEQVVFDLETTGLEPYSHILQIAAASSAGSFCRYVRPERPINPKASAVTGLSFDGQSLFLIGKKVASVSIRQALTEFLEFLGDQPVTLFAHNGKRFDSVVLLTAVSSCGMLPAFEKQVTGFVDTLPLFRELCPELASHKQETLYRHFFQSSYAAHDALSDVRALAELLVLPYVTPEAVSRHSFGLEYIQQLKAYSSEKKRVLATWGPMVSAGSVSQYMAAKAAASGLDVHHLTLAYHREGQKGVQNLLSATGSDGKPRVTKVKRFLVSISNYIAQYSAEENE